MAKVAFDGFWWVNGPPSGRNVVQSLVRTWANSYPDDLIEVFTPIPDVKSVEDDLDDYKNIHVIGTTWRQHALFNVLSIKFGSSADLVIHQNFSRIKLPFVKSGKHLVFYHDALSQEHPEWFTLAERIYMRLASFTLSLSDSVATSSVSEARRIVRHNPSLRVPVAAVGLALPTSFTRATTARPETNVESDGFLLTVGRLNVRKNIQRLIASLREEAIITPSMPLVVVGSPNGRNLEFEEDDSDVIFTGYISDSELKWLYKNSRAFIFPSLDEGFGLPILEASYTSTPMAISDIPAFREFGEESHFFDPRDKKSISAAVLKAMNETRSSSDLNNHYSWEKTVAAIRRVAALDKR